MSAKQKRHAEYTLLAFILAALSMLGPFAVDTYLPAFPTIAQSLNTTSLHVQQTLTVYMAAFAVMILWHGALADAYGRRTVLLWGLAMFAIGSLGCAASHSVEYLWAFRILQGVSAGAGVVIGRAIIRDKYNDVVAARLLALVTMIFSVAPAIAPIMGGWIVTALNWRAIFLFMLAFTLLLFWICYQYLPESLPAHKRRPFNPQYLWDSYKQVFSTRIFHLKSGAIAFNFAGLFLYVAAAPVFVTQHLKLGTNGFGWQFFPAVAGIFLGAMAANRMAGKISLPKQVNIGYGFMLFAGIINVAYHSLYAPAIPWSVIPLFFYTIGMCITAPALTLFVLDLYPQMRGLVSSCQSFTQTMLAAGVSGLVAPLLSHSVLWLATGQLLFALLGLTLWSMSSWLHTKQVSTALNTQDIVDSISDESKIL